jgi:hypothetical protein
MIYKEDTGAEVIGVIFLYHIFEEMAELGHKTIKRTETIMKEQNLKEENMEVEMDSLDHELLRKK